MEVSVREFRAKLSSYLDLLREGEVIRVRGIYITRCDGKHGGVGTGLDNKEQDQE